MGIKELEGVKMKNDESITIKSYPKFLKDEHDRGVKMGILGDHCFVHGCKSKSPLYPSGDARFYCGMCEEHAGMKDRYKYYFRDKLDELQGMLYLGAIKGAWK